MEDFEATSVETFDELVTRHTRRELEELALKLGVENMGTTKSQLADAILEASKKQREQPKSIPAVPKEAPMVEKPKSAEKPVTRGSKGVMAKAAAIDSKTAEVQKAGKDIREEGMRRMNQGAGEFNSACDWMTRQMQASGKKMMEDSKQRLELGLAEFSRSLDAQIKENQDSAAKMHSAVQAMQASQANMSRSFLKAGSDIRDSGGRNLQNGLKEFQGKVNSQINANQNAAARMNSGARELQGRAASFHSEIHRYVGQDLKNYIRDFYYG